MRFLTYIRQISEMSKVSVEIHPNFKYIKD